MVKASHRPDDRLREHPSHRFSGPHQAIDLKEAIDDLKAEPSGQHGHKQINLFKHGPATLALYHLDQGARVDNHVVDGSEIIHVLSGRLAVHTEDQTMELPAQNLLRLRPGVAHSFEGREDCDMLMIVCVEGPNSHT